MSLSLRCDHASFIEWRTGTQNVPKHQGSYEILEHHRPVVYPFPLQVLILLVLLVEIILNDYYHHYWEREYHGSTVFSSRLADAPLVGRPCKVLQLNATRCWLDFCDCSHKLYLSFTDVFHPRALEPRMALNYGIMPCLQNLPLGYLATELSSGG